MTTSGATSDKEWQRVIQWVATSDKQIAMSDSDSSGSSGTTNENSTVHFKEWMIAIFSMTKADTLLPQGMDGCN